MLVKIRHQTYIDLKDVKSTGPGPHNDNCVEIVFHGGGGEYLDQDEAKESRIFEKIEEYITRTDMIETKGGAFISPSDVTFIGDLRDRPFGEHRTVLSYKIMLSGSPEEILMMEESLPRAELVRKVNIAKRK